MLKSTATAIRSPIRYTRPRESIHPLGKVLKLSIPRDFHLNHDYQREFAATSFLSSNGRV